MLLVHFEISSLWAFLLPFIYRQHSSAINSPLYANHFNSNKAPKAPTTKTFKHGRTSKDDIQNLVQSMGLTPVTQAASRKGTSKSEACTPQTTSTRTISTETQLQYARNGHAVLRSMISIEDIHSLRSKLIDYANQKEIEAWKQKVMVKLGSNAAQQCQTISDCQNILLKHEKDMILPFLQHFNIWRDDAAIHTFIVSSSLAQAAKTLMDVKQVKLYQDSLFIKRQEDGPTPWHSDARMAPFDTSHMITFWIPLSYIPTPENGGTALYFVDKSHSDFALPFWNRVPQGDVGTDDYIADKMKFKESREYDRLDERYNGEKGIQHYMPLNIGDCTVHSGWTLHSADDGSRLEKQEHRYAFTVTFVDARAEIRENLNRLGHSEDLKSYDSWIRDIQPRTYFEHPSVPIIP